MSAVAAAARLLARMGLVEAFGHVSARAGGGHALTSTRPLAAHDARDVVVVGPGGEAESGPAGECPLELPLHAALYAARPDVGAVCRTHSRHAVAWGSAGRVPPLLHGLGLLAGEVALHGESDLVADGAAGGRAAASLGAADCLLLRGNGALATGRDLRQALVRAWFLEERARVATDVPGAEPWGVEEVEARARHSGAEEVRAWRYLATRFAQREEEVLG